MHLVVLSGAGISAESGLQTFRASDGLWEQHRIEDVATPDAFERNPALVLEFYNQRRRQLALAKPNPGHLALAAFEQKARVSIITQNVDDLHERAQSSFVLHLHGELKKSRSTRNPKLVYNIQGTELVLGDVCELGSQLRPHIVWFGEAVPAMDEAIELIQQADALLVVGTSLNVYPAAGLVDFLKPQATLIVVDPCIPPVKHPNLIQIAQPASTGILEALNLLNW